MANYKDFKDYMQDNFYNDIFDGLKPYIARRKDSFENDDFYNIKWVDLEDIHVSGVSFKDIDGRFLEIRTSIDADICIQGRTRGGYDSESVTKAYNVFFNALLENGLHQVKITGVEEYNPNLYDKDKSLSQNLVSYMYEEDVEKHAEDFLRRHFPKALLQPMALPVEEIVESLGMKLYYAPLEDGVFGKTFFGREKVQVFDSPAKIETYEIITEPGTMLINPDVYFMYNIGTANNTIIHECVHWDRHRRPFELQKLLNGNGSHISCEIVKEYDGIPVDAPALKWMEWQANQLAPRILMPGEMTKRIYNSALRDIHESRRFKSYAEEMNAAVGEVALHFQVSLLAAKIRLIDLGYDEVQGTFIYNNGKYLVPFYFKRGTLKKNQTFVIDEQSAMIQIYMNESLRTMFFEGRLIYVNCMVCIDSPKYVNRDSEGRPFLTAYALDHADECCYVFKRKISASDTYSDTFYRICFLCREVSSDTYIEAEYDEEHTDNQDKKERREEINKITESVADIVRRLANEIPGGFAGTLNYHMKRKGITNEELAYRTNISTVSISGYRNSLEPNISLANATAICNGLKLEKHYSRDLMRKAGYDLTETSFTNYMIGWIIDDHPDDTLEQWQEKLDEAKVNIKLPGCA